MGGSYTYSFLLLCIFIKTSIFSSISFCISFKREFKARIITLKGFWNPFPASLCKPLRDHLGILLPQESSRASGEVAYGVCTTQATSLLPSPIPQWGRATGRGIRGLSTVSRWVRGQELFYLSSHLDESIICLASMPVKWRDEKNKSRDPLPSKTLSTPIFWPPPRTEILYSIQLSPNSWQKWSTQNKTNSSWNGTSHLSFSKNWKNGKIFSVKFRSINLTWETWIETVVTKEIVKWQMLS